MACIYNYKGHRFNSELELDDFLLENKRFEPILGDLVFSRTSAQNNVSSILSIIAKDSVQLQKKYKEWQKQNKIVYNEDGDESFEQPPYIGVNKFLSGLKNEAGTLLFPEFREDEYWSRRYSNWKIGQFNDAELEEFGFDKNNPPKITDPEQHKKLREQMTHKWEIQAKTGTAIHNVLQLCFSRINGDYAFNMSDAELRTYIQDNIDKDNTQYLNDTTIQQAIQYARNLNQDLIYKFGDGLAFYPEFVISQDTNVVHGGSPTKLLGIIDLLIVDKEGKTHILDYKTSIHSYSEFSDPKKNAYSYQLAVYQRMLEKYGINTYGGQLLVAPIQISGFRKDGDDYIYDGIQAPNSFISINTSLNSDKMWENIDEFMPAPFKLSVTAEKVNQTITEMMSKWYPDYSDTRKVTRDWVVNRLKRLNKLVPNENGVYTYEKYEYKQAPITATSEAEFVDKVLKYEQGRPASRLRYTQNVKQYISEGIKNGIENVNIPPAAHSNKLGEKTWVRDTIAPYCDGNWEIVNNNLLESYGIIMLKTIEGAVPEQIDFIRVSTNDLYENYRDKLDKKNPLRNRKLLTGTYENDIVQQSKPNQLMAECLNGNIELMEIMLILNQSSGLEGKTIGNIQVINPRTAESVQLSNEQLLYCFNELNKHDSVQNNKILNGKTKFATKYELLSGKLTHIIRTGTTKKWRDNYKYLSSFQPCLSLLDEAASTGDVEEMKKAVSKIIVQLQNDDNLKYTLKDTYTRRSDLSKPAIELYNAALYALAQLNNINFRQQIKDHDKWLESINILNRGASGSRTDNPGNLDSETLNLITTLVMQAYQNTRDDLQRSKPTLDKLIDNLKKEKGFNLVEENTIGNQANLYSNLYEITPDGDFMFKHIDRVYGAEKDLLEYALDVINKNRMPGLTEEEYETMKNNGDPRYYRVPLAQGGSDSVASRQGLLAALRSKLSYLLPKRAFERAQRAVEGIFNAQDSIDENNSYDLFKMTNYFDGGETDNRIDKIREFGIENFEHNLETLLLKHQFAYSVKDNIDAVFPLIKASMVHLGIQGSNRNTEFVNDRSYLEDYIKNKILNKSIVGERFQKWVNRANMLKQAASMLTLGAAPVQAIYQPLQGLWTDISLIIRKPDGKESFTFNNFRQSLKIVYSDLSHFSDTPTLCSALNELYAMNDMDMNSYVDNISSGRKGFWNPTHLLFKFSQRPDYYNRMAIFVAQMIGDGCFDAHSIQNGRLIYDWKKDKRFEAFANGKTSDPQYNKQKALYYTIAQQFVKERAKNQDGSLFTLDMNNPMPLPRAYTSREAESMKDLSDKIYGYYTHEKKSLIMSSAVGSLWLQMKNYWSGKKNQYLQPGGVKVQGDWKHYFEYILDPSTGKQKKSYYFYQVDSNGNILFDQPPLSEQEMNRRNIPTIAPFMQWEGLWQEGIILTLSNMFKDMVNQKSLVKGWNSIWNADDERLRNVYRSNIKQLGYDLSMFTIGGLLLGAILSDWLDEMLKDNKKNRDLSTGMALAASNIAVMSVKNSFMDFNMFTSVLGPLGQWTPFAFEWGSRTLKNWWNVAMGDEDFWDGVVKTSGGLKQIKPALDAIKPDMFRNEREGGTFGVEE